MNNNPTYYASLLILIITLLFNVVSMKADMYDLKMKLDRIENLIEGTK